MADQSPSDHNDAPRRCNRGKPMQPGQATGPASRWPARATMAALALALSPAVLARTQPANPTAQTSAAPAGPWLAYLRKLKSGAGQSASVQSAMAGVKAADGSVSAQTGDRDLSLDANYTDYPNGAGTGPNGSFTNLQQRGEIRADWGMLDFFGRRPGRIASAKAKVAAAQANVVYTTQQRESMVVNRSVAQWSAAHQRQALQHALSDLQEANQALRKLQNRALGPRLSATVNQAYDRALSLQIKVSDRLAALPARDHTLPAPPVSYWSLPRKAPSAAQLARVAKHAPRAAQLRAQAQSYKAQSRAHWAQHFKFNVYAGYVHEKVRNLGGYQNGPEVGASLTIPLGGWGGGQRANARWQARQQHLAAQAAQQQQARYLRQVRAQWVQAVANLHSEIDLLRHQAQRYHVLHERYVSGAGTKTPEPWQLQIQGAEFWQAVAGTWRARGHWVKAVMLWTVLDQSYLHHHTPSGPNVATQSLCAPLAHCPRA